MEKHERYAMWSAWGITISACLNDTELAPTMPDDIRESFRQSLADIALRDAILAQSAREPEFRPALKQVLAVLAEDENVPARTMLACMEFLDNDLEAADALVSSVLEADDYSLARLIKTGLEINAPASLLASSFSHYSPEEHLNA